MHTELCTAPVKVNKSNQLMDFSYHVLYFLLLVCGLFVWFGFGGFFCEKAMYSQSHLPIESTDKNYLTDSKFPFDQAAVLGTWYGPIL